ncbi:DNA excision repair protein ERCC-6-like 2 isoform X1 [Scomber japonicus]|uniref:DNA excision repair protein ERCC-6-like 2 isoform X1 n=2 Tax=Scomber japonicus TaxID=13676 RepID=UPI0023058F0C|nr:DNA excision repair protein ERCC-6-like 2 isoform X1 [Scomber japonicus]
MASTTAVEKETWHEGDRCLAPNPRDGTLREGTIQRLTSTSHSDDTTAWVMFTDRSKDEEGEEEEEEEAVPVSKLMRSGVNHFTKEKPVFANSVTHPRVCVPLKLGDAGGDKVPYTINRYLRDYQREGIRFIYNNYMHSRGCILGDDMGLGKTVQVIGFLAAVLHKTGTWEDIENNRPQFLQSQIPSKQSKPHKVFLIVAPLSVLYNWKDELDTWGHFQCVVVHGLRKEEELARIKKGRIEIALTTYETLRLCLDQFNNIDWSAVVVDEAHKIKNPNSQITQAMKDLKCQIRVGLTGTILQNNLEELWCVMDWAVPGCLGSLGNFKNKFSDPIEQGQRHNATKRALATGRKTVKALVKKISHRFLRRTKSLIKEQLPKKDDRVVYCSLTDFQHTVYQTVLDTEDVTLLLRSTEKCDCQSGRTRRSCCYKTNSEGVKIMDLYFSYLAILRKVANHAALLQSTAGTSKKQEKYVSAICQKVFQKFPDFVQRCKDEAFEALSDPTYSGKMKVLQKLLKYYLQKRDKVLIFSLSTKLLDVLESYCMAEGLDYSRLDGTTKSKERLQIVKEFNSSSHINLCLISTMAGGLGLNFVGANGVVLFDPTWNPANDLQAIDRAYRIGQCRDVTVLRLISLGTVEEVIYLRQVYKQQLQCSVLGKESARRYFEAVHGVHKGELFGIKNLFRLQTQGTCLTRKILEREGQVEAGVMTTSTHTGEEKEEETKRDSDPGDSSTTNAITLSDQRAKENRDASKFPRGVLDFSSGSEEEKEEQGVKRKASDSAVDSTSGGNAVTGPGRMTLLQHGFSRLLQAVKEKAELGEGDSSPDVEEISSEEDTKDQGNSGKKDSTSSGTNKCSSTAIGIVSLPKLGTRVGENRDGGRQERISLLKQTDDAVGKGVVQKGWAHKKIIVDKESDENSSPDRKTCNKLKNIVPKVHQFKGYSDESEDLDIDEMTCPKKDALSSHSRGGRVGYNRKRLSCGVRDKARSTHTEDIETFTSSEDEHTPVKKERSKGCHFTTPKTDRPRAAETDRTDIEKQTGASKAVSFTYLKSQRSPASKGEGGTIDSVLGGVQEVVYTHSNQRVVGGSRAEERISRAAVRDVFERKMYSQLPANHLLSTQESLSSSPPDSPPRPATVRPEKPSVDQPVTFTNKSVHHTRQTTFIIGETPQAICRQQLEEMAAKLKFASVHQFAEKVLRSSSTQRLAWLRLYYTSLNNPELANTVKNNFPQLDSALTSSSSNATSRTLQKDVQNPKRRSKYSQKYLEPQTEPGTRDNNVPLPQKKPKIPQNDVPELKIELKKDGSEPQKKQTNPRKNVLQAVSDVPSPESEEQEETVCSARGHKRTKRGSVSSPRASRAGGGLGVDRAGSSGLGPGEAAAFLIHRDRDTPSSLDLSHGWSTTLSKPTAQGMEREQKSTSMTSNIFKEKKENDQALSSPEQAPSTSSHRSLLTDLLGDTSILNDLLKPKLRGVQQSNSPKTSSTSSSVSTSTCLPTTPASRITVNTDPGVKDSLSSSSSHTPPQPTHQAASKGSRKDFWDILNEGNEECINRLTDLAEVKRVCINTNFAARTQSVEDESKSLWKTNEKFLWKK